MMLLATGDGCVDELLFHEGDPAVAGILLHALPGIRRGCELARRLEAELPRISSQTQLLLLSCQQIVAVFGEAASSLMSTGHGTESSTSTPPYQHHHISPVSTPTPHNWYLNSPPTHLQQQRQQHNPLLTTPQYHQQQHHNSPHQYCLYAVPSSPACPGPVQLGVDEFLADVDLDFLSGEEFNLGSLSSPEVGCDAVGGADGQYSSGSVDIRTVVSVAAGGVTEAAGGSVDAVAGKSAMPGAAPAKEAKAGEEVDTGNTSKSCPTVEGYCRQRLSKKRKDAGDCVQMQTIRLPAPRTGDLEAPPDDGYAWRKYGHKDILHARFPRCYYRCINKSCCDAKKQVQRLDHDPFTYEITYYGHHTCRVPLEDAAAGQRLMPQATMPIAQSSSTSDLQAHPRRGQAGDSSTTSANKKARRPPTN